MEAVLVLGCVDLDRPAGLGPCREPASCVDASRADARANEALLPGPGDTVGDVNFGDATPAGRGSATGASCAGAVQCASGFCVDGVCCATECKGSCHSCNQPTTPGACTPIAAGTDPKNGCAADDVATCKQDGFCDGTGACRLQRDGTMCEPALCSDAVASTARSCDGKGTCRAATTKACAPFACAGSVCASACAGPDSCAVGYACNGGQCTSLSIGLVGHWKLDEGTGTTTADASGTGNAGTLVNGPTWSNGGFPAAKFANPFALALDGQDDHVRLGTKSLPGTNAPKTISAWIHHTAVPTSMTTIIALNDVPVGGLNSSGAVQVGFQGQRLTVWKSGGGALVTASATPPSGWHHVAYTFDCTTHRLYVDGGAPATSTSANDSASTTAAWLGTYNGVDEVFGGRLDDVRIYTRALSVADVSALFAGH